MIGAAYAQLSAVTYGVSDFVGGVAARRVAALRVMLVVYPIETFLLGGLALAVGGPISRGAIFWGCLYGVGMAVGMWAFFAALGAGPISVVSPLAAVLNAAVPVAVGVTLGERPGPGASVGVVLALIAVMLVSREATAQGVTPYRFTPKVAWLTLLAGSAMGLNLVFLHQAPHACKLWPLVFARLAATVVIFVMAAASNNLRAPRGKPLKLAWAVAVLDICANVTMLLALHTWLLSLASILISLYPAATVVLAMVVLRERLTRWQGFGMVMAMGSVAMIAAS
ncbi:putative membrane protein [Mycobacterium parascrofulaceum ATCC BAA-614]|uniref:Putative membrane protein n=1 Tax=Mycobacterium parascrofulaceum ATCC BAA-614 TaxID=525368 RepID=D5PDS1_9MYCO|nr:putative membrane protein [Mycobacterium parascrofulaceum ATCC BAA-614]